MGDRGIEQGSGAAALPAGRRNPFAFARPSRRRCALLAWLAYLLLVVWTLAAVLIDPWRWLPYNAGAGETSRLTELDQMMVVSVIARNAETLVTEPWNLRGDSQCYPMPRGYTLGEHMFGAGLFAALPYALTADPIASFNAAFALHLFVPAVAMYALAFHFTRSPPAAFVAGLLFAFRPTRIADPTHMFVHADIWVPLVLLFLHRVFARGRLRDGLGLALFGSLQVLESFYVVLSCAILAAAYACHLAWRYAPRLRRALMPLAGASAVVALVAWFVLAPYMETNATWDLPARSNAFLLLFQDYLPSGRNALGWTTILAAAVGVFDRIRRKRGCDGDDPRLALLFGGFLIAWFCAAPIGLPGVGLQLPSLYSIAREWIPGVSSVRAIAAVGGGILLPMCLLAAFGMLALVEHRRPAIAVALAAGAVFLILVERLHPAVARFSFPDAVAVGARDLRPPESDLRLIREKMVGPVLDLPASFPTKTGRLNASTYLMLSAYRPAVTAACYNSFVSPLAAPVWELAHALPAARAVDALAALGFRSFVLHKDMRPPKYVSDFERKVATDLRERLVKLGESDRLIVYRVRPLRGVTESFAALEQQGEPEESAALRPPGAVRFRLVNSSAQTFRHPEPIRPSDLVVSWTGPDGQVLAVENVRAVLPLALAPGDHREISLELRGPGSPGRYLAAVNLRGAAGRPLGLRWVTVDPPSSARSVPRAHTVRRRELAETEPAPSASRRAPSRSLDGPSESV